MTTSLEELALQPWLSRLYSVPVAVSLATANADNLPLTCPEV